MTGGGGISGVGTVFQLTPAGTLTTIYTFSGSGGVDPQGALVQGTDGSFYGTTSRGGPTGYGTDGNFYGTTSEGGPGISSSIFKITPAGALTVLASFNGQEVTSTAGGLVEGRDGNF
jgi:uncharacterized repeat protein (TIGR03803 family)